MQRIRLYLVITILSFQLLGCAEDEGNVDNNPKLSWQFLHPVDSNWYDATIPGSIQEDLLENNLIPDPYDELNEDSIRWVEESNWQYSTTLSITDNLLAYDHLELVFKGLDTYAKVFVNDSIVIESGNMFREYRTDIRKLVKRGDNVIQVFFESPIEHNREVLKIAPYQLPSSESVELKVAPLVRKAAYQFGWDFSPRIVTMGIWQPVVLEGWDNVKLVDVHFIPKQITDSLAQYDARIIIESSVEKDFIIELNGVKTEVSLNIGKNSFNKSLIIEQPQLWWPNGMGEQHLYEITTNLLDNSAVVDSDTAKLGVRTINLIQDVDEVGTSFRFVVNGEDIFVKGANWSPLSSFPASISDSTYQNRLRLVKEANMNMLRVWGGGIYESNQFYELCDEYGILVWQDFMFANTMYLPSKTFFESVKAEVDYQVKRLQNHPSIALWNGNNEIEVAWNNWGWQDQYGYSDTDSSELWHFYQELFDDFIPSALAELAPNANYTATSPLSNWGRVENFNHGSMHYWGVWHGNDNFEDFAKNTGRFMAEYGFQSYPSVDIFQDYYHLDKIHLDSNKLLHQKSYVGNQLILRESERYFGKSESTEDFLEKSQKTQALAMKMAIEAHRLSPKCDGTLFWQLNDCWPGPSWSVIGVNGAPKLAYEVVKDRYKPNIIVVKLIGDDLEIHIVNDKTELISVQMSIEMIRYDGERIWAQSKEFENLKKGSMLAYKSHRMKLLDGMKEEDVTLGISLKSDDILLDLEYLYFTVPKDYKSNVDLIGID